ncbi:hypothetical protein E3P89_00053 [Wallemia ichthyophaga]|uniref:serine--tRNA ligase n=2 Tax=Wallemia ichthyophaga TaxID=245174 RepID=A0A4T0EZ45_WALIC|nr:uncharacterized protein J056_002258 [Wallemia ichthyophaga EXF-994]TIA80442.1 hypothetical protein E3P98_02653 [Wallemia ichthyophaga]EOR04180.1 hypothetical protein J056_002258 [Wallemia ichthyophaga EXF-994]TIA94449.1 hypothetical protein E3P97_00115 [Wallemia ichthyophaga]TIB04819.1 hypothetical protein E3P95_00114 [Wallemia ichthyophaga]TIB06013.1 hypothetical protein E3P94_00114 [Wallemia ichthyophaga]
MIKPRLNYKGIRGSLEQIAQNNVHRNAKVDLSNYTNIYNTSSMLEHTLNATKHTQATTKSKELKREIKELEGRLRDTKQDLYEIASQIPNESHPSSPTNNVAVEVDSGGPPPIRATRTRDHLDIAARLNGTLPLSAANVSGNGFAILKAELAVLEHVLIQHALHVAVGRGYTLVTVPDIVKMDIANRCGFVPRDTAANQTYTVSSSGAGNSNGNARESNSDSNSNNNNGPNTLCLAATAEIPLAGLHFNDLLKHKELPIKYVACGHAFRAEAGARGRDTRGLYRLHQFTKVELFSLTDASSSDAMLDEIVDIQREIVQTLNVPYRILDMPTQELGASAYRKYDVEAWMPGREEWGEVSSASNCIDYQARRLLIRYKTGEGNVFVHTLNGTAAAIPRLILALVENGVESDESANLRLALPKSLRKYWIGSDKRIRWQ